MPATYEKIATTTLGSAAASIDFTSIPSTYTDLRISFVTTSTVGNADVYMRLNSDTGTNYSRTILYGDGSSALSQRNTSVAYFDLNYAGYVGVTYPASFQIDLFSYAGSTYKTILSANSVDKNGAGAVEQVVGLWRSTSAITAISLSLEIGYRNLPAGATATLYGIKAA